MAATFAFRSPGIGFTAPKVPGALFWGLIEVTADNSYPAQGYPFTATQLVAIQGGTYSQIDTVCIANNWTDNNASNGAKCFTANFDKTHNTVRAFSGGSANTTETEVATGNSALNGLVCTLLVSFY